uniref:Putative ovule protein n=1 Tax=Solanum chacoense TaxID=4108 RepID=A0A0V0GZH1_SOLCH
MVSRVEATMKIRQQTEVKNSSYMIMQCKKGKTNKFKRSSSNVEEDGASAAILLLACIACTTTTTTTSSHL